MESDEVDHRNGVMVKCANRRLRYAILQAADCLINNNNHFGGLASGWRSQGKDKRLIHTRVACRFARIAFQMVAGRQVFRHPAARDRHYILEKLLRFHTEHWTPSDQVQADLQAARQWLAPAEQPLEAIPLQRQLDELRQRRRGAQAAGQVLSLVLAELGARVVQSVPSGH